MMYGFYISFVFFFKQKTAYEMRISDWSSDVCSSDLEGTIPAWEPEPQRGALKGEFPNNPKIDAEKPLFTITKANMAKYEDKLTEGHKKLLNLYSDYKMNV